MTVALLFGLCAAVVIVIGTGGLLLRAHLLRRILAFNIVGSGIFLIFGSLGHRAPQLGADPVPQAMVITGIVVALAATALAITLALRLFEETGSSALPSERAGDGDGTD